LRDQRIEHFDLTFRGRGRRSIENDFGVELARGLVGAGTGTT
jgi:hypothetical protein